MEWKCGERPLLWVVEFCYIDGGQANAINIVIVTVCLACLFLETFPTPLRKDIDRQIDGKAMSFTWIVVESLDVFSRLEVHKHTLSKRIRYCEIPREAPNEKKIW